MAKSNKDQLSFGPVTPSGRVVLRRRNEDETPTVEMIAPVREGEPFKEGEELIRVSQPCKDGWHDVTVLYRHGPAQVATPAYREGYDRIFGKKASVGSA